MGRHPMGVTWDPKPYVLTTRQRRPAENTNPHEERAHCHVEHTTTISAFGIIPRMAQAGRRLVGSPLKWLILYVALIPAFAAWYLSLPPRSLQDSNIERERSLESDAIGLLPALTAMAKLSKATAPVWKTSGITLRLRP